jgi:hypothetical protein
MKDPNINVQICNESKRSVFEYILPDSIRLALPFILTKDKKLTIGMPYMKLEGHHTTAVKLIDAWEKDGVAYLKLQELKTDRVYTVSCKIERESEFWLWSLASYDYLVDSALLNIKRGSTGDVSLHSLC